MTDWTLVHDEVLQRRGGTGYAVTTGRMDMSKREATNISNCTRRIRIPDGIASSSSFTVTKEVADGRVTYTLTGERVVFGLGLAFPSCTRLDSAPARFGHREVFRVQR